MRVYFMFAHPRSISTAFERIMIERNDLKVFHEPFSQMYYYHYKTCPVVSGKILSGKSYSEIKEEILTAAEKKNVFVKDMAYHVFPQLQADHNLLKNENITFTMLIRHPRKAIASHYKMNPQVTFDELGYSALYLLYQQLQRVGREIHIIDAEDLEQDPQATVDKYCKVVGLPFDQRTLKWNEDEAPQLWDAWYDWHTDAIKSAGIHINKKSYHGDDDNLFPEIPECDRSRFIEYYRKCLFFYNQLIIPDS